MRYNTILLRMIPGDLLSACPIDSSTHYPAFKRVGLHFKISTLTSACLCREAVCTICMLVYLPGERQTR